MTVISEAASETDDRGRRKPGRPRLIPDELDSAYRRSGTYSGTKTRRGELDMIHRIEAIGVLKDEPERFGWLYDHKTATAGGGCKLSILTELGRIADPEAIKAAADRICELKPKTKQAIVMIRRFRLGTSPKPSIDDLELCILRAIDKYIAEHPETKDDHVLAALQAARWTVIENPRST